MYGSTHIRDVFSQNLKELMKDSVSVTHLSRELDLNRTQVNRFLTGESAPRPEILSRICEYFNVDARILTTSVGDLAMEQAKNRTTMLQSLASCMVPVPTEVLPNGLFEEWRLCDDGSGDFVRSLVLISSDAGLRKVTRSMPTQRQDLEPGEMQPMRKKYYGQAIVQPGGFNILEHIKDGRNLRFKAFRYGYDGEDRIFPGIDLNSAPLGLRRHKKMVPLILIHLIHNAADFRRIRRGFGRTSATDVPTIVRRAVQDIGDQEQTFL